MIGQNNSDNINEFVKKFNDFDIFNNKNCVYVQDNKNNNNNIHDDEKIFIGPRVGLSLKYPEYLFKGYRFLRQPNKIPKYKKTIVSNLHHARKTNEEINKLTSISTATINKAINEYNDGKNMTDEEIKKLTVKDINKLYGFYLNKK
jgi:hypothetical protein